MDIRKSSERGHFNFGWLDTYHTFSFGEYYDPDHTEFGVLRVINDDTIGGGGGFGLHGHANMEIVTYMVQGTLKHTDSLGHAEELKAGEVQRMTAGRGIRHSEINASLKEAAHLLQIWIHPEKENLPPSYEQKPFSLNMNELCLIVSKAGEKGALKIHQDVKIFACLLNDKLSYTFDPQRKGWLQVVDGSVVCNGETLSKGDGAALTEKELNLVSSNTHFLLFDIPL